MFSRHHPFRLRRFLVVLFLSSLTFCLCLNDISFKQAIAQTPNATQLVQQGIERYRAGDVQGSIAVWKTALTTYQGAKDYTGAALVQEKLAIAHQQIGQLSEAINDWKGAIANYRASANFVKVGQLLTEQAQTHSRLGQNKQAIVLLCGASETDDCPKSEGSALQIAEKFSDRPGEAAALGSLGEAYRLRGNYSKAIQTLETSLKVIQAMNPPLYRASVLNSLGNAYVSRATLNEQRAGSARLRGAETKASEFAKAATTDYKQALDYFNNSLELTRTQNDQAGQMRTLLNLIQLYDLLKDQRVEQRRQEASALLERLPNSSSKVYAAIDLAGLGYSPSQCSSQKLNSQAEQLLKQAVTLAQTIQDSRAASFAIGNLGHLYECRKNYDTALNLTQQARLAADQNLRAQDSIYLWEWQAGRVFKAQAKEAEARKAYERAIATLEGEGGIRDNLLIANRDLQFGFRDTISPLYREFAELKLDRAESLPIASQEYQRELDSALDTVDSLKLAELQNYFGNECVFAVFDKERIDDLEREDTAVFSSVILEGVMHFEIGVLQTV